MSAAQKQRVLVLYGGENATFPRAELCAWLGMTKSLNAEPTIVADDVPHSEGSVNDRVTEAIKDADKAIALVTIDARSKFGAPNVIEEIGRWVQGKGARTLCVVRQEGTEINSNMQGAVYLAFRERIKEAFEGIRKFLEDAPAPTAKPAAPASSFTLSSSTTFVLLEGRLYRRARIDEAEQKLTAVLDCDGPAEAALRAVRRGRVELTFGNNVVRGYVDEPRFTHEGDHQLATVVISKRDSDSSQAHMYDAAWGGVNSLSADEIATMRATRILTGEPKATTVDTFGPEMLIRGGSHDGIEVTQSPIPGFLATHPRDVRETWEHLRLELVRQLILSRAVERIERLQLTVSKGRLAHITFRGIRHQYYSNHAPHTVEVDEAVDF
ncbi:MAG: nucleotide-binding protein [Deltaproteobacteria bacterium]|nr:nucleotide-binding protein [Deltaproteobacteria bacterium]